MKRSQSIETPPAVDTRPASEPDLLTGPMTSGPPRRIDGVVVGELLAITEGGETPLVTFHGQPGAVPGRTAIDLDGTHIGRRVVLMFEDGNSARPIVMGLIRGGAGWDLESTPRSFNVTADGEQLILTARKRLVLRCGKASIILTRAGKVLIEGEYVSSRSSGVNRVKGASVQLN